MKKIVFFISMLLFTASPSFAQLSKEQINERKEIRKLAKSDLKEKASKSARKEAKKLQKEGWTIAPGALPIDKQLDKSYLMQMEYDENMFPKYLMGEAMSIGENYDAAEIPTLYQRATAICKMHKAQVRANNYYWNKLYRKLEIEGLREEFEENRPVSNQEIC